MVARFRLRRPCRPRPKRRGAAIAATAKFIQRVLPAILLLVGDVLEAIERTLAHLAANTRATSPADLGRIELSGSSPVIEFQLLTGTRPGEVRLATWSEIDLDRAAWTIPSERVKSGRAFEIHLSRPAIALLGHAKTLSGLNMTSERQRTDFVFPGTNGGSL